MKNQFSQERSRKHRIQKRSKISFTFVCFLHQQRCTFFKYTYPTILPNSPGPPHPRHLRTIIIPKLDPLRGAAAMRGRHPNESFCTFFKLLHTRSNLPSLPDTPGEYKSVQFLTGLWSCRKGLIDLPPLSESERRITSGRAIPPPPPTAHQKKKSINKSSSGRPARPQQTQMKH